MSSDDFNPYRAPEASLTTLESAADPGPLRPVPFEDTELEPRFWPRVWAMFSILFRDPKGLADRIPVTRSMTKPCIFLGILSIPVYLFWIAIAALIFFTGALAEYESGTKGPGAPPLWLLGLIPLGVLVLVPIVQTISVFVAGTINHGCLWLWGGLKQGQDMNATIRACAYFFGFFTLVAWIPLIGTVALVAGPAALGYGLARIHRTDTWRGICAAYSPLLACCCIYGLFFLVMMGLAASGILGH